MAKRQPFLGNMEENMWQFSGLVVLSARFVQGWIFWGGGSRRFIYDPSKLDPYSPQWMANKLQSAIPGALLGTGDIINYLLQHFTLLYITVLAFSAAELLCGLGLLLGIGTRLCAFGSALISVLLMLLFGWQGSTCIDEWTMAIATLSIGFTITLAGGAIYSVDHLLLWRYPQLNKKWWFLTFASGHLPFKIVNRLSIGFLCFTILFALMTYNYYRGSIFTPYHQSPVSSATHQLQLSAGKVARNGAVTFTAYVDAGTPAVPAFVIRVELLNNSNHIIEEWHAHDLSVLSPQAIHNVYPYNHAIIGEFGLVLPLSAKAIIQLPASSKLSLHSGKYQLALFLVNGSRFILPLQLLNA